MNLLDRKNSTHIVHQTTKALLTTTVALALLLPGGLAAADSSSTSAAAAPVKEASGQATATPDASKAKITQDQAVAKLRELFPVLKDAAVSSVRLGGDNSYPSSTNQMVWNINWGYELGNTSYGFSSMIDAVSGDLVSTSISFPLAQDTAYYPPKLSSAEALEKARSFIAKAAPSLGQGDIQLEDDTSLNLDRGALFGTVKYSFSFNILKNGLPTSDVLWITIDGNGNVVLFNKPAAGLVYPSAKPAVSLESAKKDFADSLSVGLYYIPVYTDNQVDKWILGWQPREQNLYPIDAQSGKRIDNDGKEASSLPVSDETVPQTKERFQPISTGKEISAAEAAKLVQQVVSVPAERKLVTQMLGTGYPNTKQKVWRLSWEAERKGVVSGFPSRSYAEIDASTGQIYQFQLEQFTGSADAKLQPAPAGGKKLTQKEAKQQAISLINRLYDQASTELKLAGHDEAWSVLKDEQGFRYEFVRYYKGIPISDAAITLVMDSYGRLQNYSAVNNAGVEMLKEPLTPVLSKSEALQSYKEKYTLKLQYKRIGGYSNIQYVEPKEKLVYNPVPVSNKDQYEVLDAITNKWVKVYPYAAQFSNASTAADLKGHPAEKQLTELLKYGVLTPDADGKLKPDQEITVGEWVTFIAKASTPYYTGYSTGTEQKVAAGVSRDSKYYPAISYAVSHGWISKDTQLQPDNSLSREQLAVLLASFLKYNKLSAFLQNDSAVSSFSDASAIQDKGAVALVVKLGLMQGEGGKFNPQQKVTRADAASVIMKLVELQDKTDQVIGQQ